MNLLALAAQIGAGKFQANLEKHLPAEAVSRLHGTNAEGIYNRLQQVIRNPIDLSGEMSNQLLELYYTTSWFNFASSRNGISRSGDIEAGGIRSVYQDQRDVYETVEKGRVYDF